MIKQQLKTFGLFGLLTLIFVGVGFFLGGASNPYIGMGIFLAFAVIMNVIMYFFCDKIALRSYRARVIEEHENPYFYGVVREVIGHTELPMPRVAIIPIATPNAFATGRNPKHAVVAATEGILQLLDRDELKGVIAHEVGHIKNRDILVTTVAATIAGALAFFARIFLWSSFFGNNRNILVLLLVTAVAAIGAVIIQMMISRTREYLADETGARIIGNPQALARALKKLEYGNSRYPMRQGNPASSSLFIVNPFRGNFVSGLFSTHPPMKKRIERLYNL